MQALTHKIVYAGSKNLGIYTSSRTLLQLLFPLTKSLCEQNFKEGYIEGEFSLVFNNYLK